MIRQLDLARLRPEDFAPFRMDTVICLNVLEHIQDDQETLRRCCALLPSGGRVVLIIPALQRLYGEIDKVIGH